MDSFLLYPVITENTKKLPVYLSGIGVQKKEAIDRTNGLGIYQISYVAKGRGVFTSGGKTVNLYEGDCFIFRPNVPHSYYSLSEDYKNYWVIFDGFAADSLFNQLTQGGTDTFSVENMPEQENMFKSMVRSAENSDKFYDENNSAVLYSYILKTAQNKHNNPVGIKRQRFLPVLEYIEKNYKSAVSLDELAGIAKLTKYRFCGAFKETFGISAMKYLIQYRIKKSKELFSENPDSTVEEIAKASGFNDVSYFCAVFKNQEGVTPASFRNLKKNKNPKKN